MIAVKLTAIEDGVGFILTDELVAKLGVTNETSALYLREDEQGNLILGRSNASSANPAQSKSSAPGEA